jgi:hypothetical protein
MATKSTQLKKALKIASKVKSKAGVKQNPPQSTSYTKKADKEVPAKAVGYRFTDRFINSATGKALGLKPSSKPTATQIEKYKDKKYSDDTRYIYSEARKDKSDVVYKNKLKKGGATQNPPQSTSYTVENDKGDYAKPVGYRFTDRFINSATGKRLKLDQSSKPTASQIEKYKNKKYSDDTRYIYSEARMDKSDKNYSRRLEDGGDIHMDLMKGDYDTSRKTQNTYLRIKTWRIWNGYTMRQKYHFLHDHGFDMVASEIANGNDIMYQELPKKVQDAFVEHTKMGQYEDGGMMARGGNTNEAFYHILEHGDYGDIGYQGYYDTLEEAMERVKELSSYYPNLYFEVWMSGSPDEPPITTMAKGGQTPPQSLSYTRKGDKEWMARPVGWRFTERGANRLGVNPYRKPYAREIEEYGNKKFFNGDSYMDYETRKDKSDIAPKTGLEKGGNVNYGRSWHLDRAKHNQSEDYEVPMNERKYARGGFFTSDKYNYGRAWHLDRAKHNQSEDYEVPMDMRKMEDGGEMKDGGLTRDRKFISKQKWEQTYERKKPASIYKSNWWWFEDGGEMADGGMMKKGGYTYVPKEFIDSITTSNDVEFDNSEILDGAYVRGRNRKFGDGGEMDDDYARGGRIANSDSSSSAENFLDFQGSNLEGKTLSNGDYVVLSYGWYPLWYYSRRNSTWYGNSTKYSPSTSKQASQSRPTYNAIMLPKEQLEKVMANSSMGIDSKEMGGTSELTK